MSPETAAPPTRLGNYDVISKIADGGMGTVYKAKHRSTGEVVAIKVIAPGPARNPILLQRFEREFVAARLLNHPNLVKGIEYCGTGPHPYLVMEYVDGESLGQRVDRDGPIPEAEAVGVIAQVCDGLQRAHKQGLVHRDVKPDNILVDPHGVAKLTDLGLVKDVEAELNLTRTGRGLGTPHYMAPEQFRNAKGVDVRGDIYSLGATLYALVTGVIPFEHASPLDCWMRKVRNEFPPPRELNPRLSERVDWAIRRAMSAEPNARPASCREFVEDLTGQSRSTRAKTPTPGAAADVWYMMYRDETGDTQTVKGNTEAIRNALREGLLGDASNILVGRSKAGSFAPLHSTPEFRDLVVGAGGTPSGAFRRSGTVPPANPRDSQAIDLGALPGGPGASGSRVGAAGGSSSGRFAGRAAPDIGSRSKVIPQVAVATPRPGRDSTAETPSGRRLVAGPKPAFNWTPVLMMLVVALSAAVVYLLLTR
jgi:serine/threonine protein kinase